MSETSPAPAGTPIRHLEMPTGDWLRLVHRSNLSRGERHAAHTLASYANVDGTRVYPGNKAVSVAMGYSKTDHAGQFIKSLGEKGWLVQAAAASSRSGKAAVYELAATNDESQIVRPVDWSKHL